MEIHVISYITQILKKKPDMIYDLWIATQLLDDGIRSCRSRESDSLMANVSFQDYIIKNLKVKSTLLDVAVTMEIVYDVSQHQHQHHFKLYKNQKVNNFCFTVDQSAFIQD